MNCTEEQAAWLAGFLDGEGCVAIMKRAEHDGGEYSPTVTISNTNREVLEQIKEWVGGGYLWCEHKKPTDPRKDIFGFKVTHRKALDMLLKVRPHMRLKTRQADLFLRYYDVAVTRRGKHRQDKTQDSFYHAMKELNRRGKRLDLEKVTMFVTPQA